ncbi:hypothetical protein [Embleya hyalina]|uniref:Uncharacterized protein n=1 Tax=Embleya hyalina TaxID=516124 RepID=A0A401YHK1_9ACTN|nr:hypothetical protein [Embleya hyalina]GCD94082.1 hypothetical protein EHYA_01738 [Embleya hyalina]
MPAIPTDLLDRIRRLEDAVRILAGRANIRPALDEILAGRVRIGEGGTLWVEAPNGEVVLATGLYAAGKYGVYAGRSEGSGAALVIGGEDAGIPQMIRIFPRPAGHGAIVMDDATDDGWLGRPWLPYPLPASVFATDWPSTTGGSWGAVSRSYAPRQHSHIVVFGSAYADTGTSGQMRLVINGTQYGPTVTAPSGGFGSLDWRGPLGAGAWGDLLTIEVQCQRTGGGGSVYAHLSELYGVNS